MEEAISEIKGEPVLEKLDPEININISAFISVNYIEDIEQRLTAYKKLSNMVELKQIVDFKKELEDRYGKLPEITKNLFLKIIFKVLAIKANIKRIDISTQEVIIHFSQKHIKDTTKLTNLIMNNSKRFKLVGDYILKVRLLRKNLKTNNSYLNDVKNILKEISHNAISL